MFVGGRTLPGERPLISALQSSTLEGLLRIIEPPFFAAECSAVDDPQGP